MEQSNIYPDTAEMPEPALGPEANFYLTRMLELEPWRVAVIKIGGDSIKGDLEPFTNDIATLVKRSIFPVIVHGGGPQIDADLAKRGIQPQKHNGIRITDEATLGSVERGLGQVNQTLVETLEAKGVEAVGITGGVFTARYQDREALGYVGEVEQVNTDPIQQAIGEGKVPIVSCLAQDVNGHPLNANGDVATRALGAAVQPYRLIMLTNVPGVLGRDGEVMSVIKDTDEVSQLIADGTIGEGMIPKVNSGMDALQSLPEDSSVVITNSDQLLKELFTYQGGGTLLRHGDTITRLPSLDAVDQQAVRKLIESAFGKQLKDDYFDDLPENTEIFITDRDYRGLAIVVPGEAGQPAYVDKLVVSPEDTGYGIGDEIIDKVIQKHPQGVYWRVRRDNKSLSWYRSKGRGQEYDTGDNKWIMFFTKEVPQEYRSRLAAEAIAREETVVPY